jgi:rare lipoprotein A
VVQFGKRGGARAASMFILGAVVLPLLAACGTDLGATVKRGKFTSAEFGVSSSPRVTRNAHPRHGGGRYLVGKPYTVRGKTYVPTAEPAGYVEQGIASWYGSDFHGRLTANGEIFSANAITAAHPTLPLPSYVRVTNLSNGRSMLVRINDRGPYMSGRVIDLSYTAAKMLDLIGHGTGEVQVAYVGPAPLNADDTRMLVASLDRATRMEQGDTRLAFAASGSMPAPVQTASIAAPVPAGPRPGDLYASEDLASELPQLFGYAEPQASSPGAPALAAADALAGQGTGLAAWAAADDGNPRVRLGIGDFADGEEAEAIAERFAMLGAVDMEDVIASGRPATRLTLTFLKPGVARADVLAMARELGLNSLVLY